MDRPIVHAKRYNAEGMLRFWCMYCAEWHHHGIGEGHRVAHCVGGTPYSKTGYILQEVEDNENGRD